MTNFLLFKYKVLPNSRSFKLIQWFLCYCMSGNKENKLYIHHTVLPTSNVLYHIVLFCSHQDKCPSLKQAIIKALICKVLNLELLHGQRQEQMPGIRLPWQPNLVWLHLIFLGGSYISGKFVHPYFTLWLVM
jgi:hypothetical protein